MRFTAQEEYGLRCLLQIAREPAGFLTIPEIARREGLTTAYVAKMMRLLRKGGFVDSTRGQHGGYRLALTPERIGVGRILATLGGRLYSDDFCDKHSGSEESCVHNVDCSIRTLWGALDAVVQRAVSGMSLQDLLHTEQEMTSMVTLRIGPRAGSDPRPLSR